MNGKVPGKKGGTVPDMRFENNTKMLLWFLRGSKRYFVFSAVSAALLGFVELINPRVVGFTVDSVIGSRPVRLPALPERILERAGGIPYLKEHLYLIALFIVCVALLDVVFRTGFRMGNARGAETLVKTMRDDLYTHIVRLPYAWHNTHQTGDIIQRCTSDVETIRSFFSEQLVQLFRSAVFILLALYFMAAISVPLMLIAAVFIPVIIINSLTFHKGISTRFRQVDEEEGRLSTIVQENLTGVRVVRAFGREKAERDRFETQNEVYQNADLNLSNLFVRFWSIGSFLSNFQRFVIVMAGALFCVKGQITGGDYIAFIGINAITTWPVRMLGRLISEMSKAGISVDRIRYIMNAEEEEPCADKETPQLSGDIAFSHVSFGFEEDKPVLRDVSFTIRGGETTGILGATGSGKSTLMYLLTRLYEPDAGAITIGGVSLDRIPRRYVREHVGIVLQEPYLFSRTIGENIAIGTKQTEPLMIREAARVAALDDTIDAFAQGYETFVGERGVTLSGGQKQRTAIAQALVRDPDVLILDDALSAVDTETDARIRESLRKKTSGMTVVLITHRITTLMYADRIIVLDSGRVAEEGTHKELLARNGIYRRVYTLQTGSGTGGEGSI